VRRRTGWSLLGATEHASGLPVDSPDRRSRQTYPALGFTIHTTGYRTVPAARGERPERERGGMDAIRLLTEDHDTVRKLFEEFRTASETEDEQRERQLQEQIFEELQTHTRIEEDIFYPAVKALDVDELTETVDEGVQEHHVVKVLMREIADLSDHDVFVAKMTVLIENVEHHAEEEESELFPELRERMGDERLEELGQELAAAK
jgi:hemerythrin superfamily protein